MEIDSLFIHKGHLPPPQPTPPAILFLSHPSIHQASSFREWFLLLFRVKLLMADGWKDKEQTNRAKSAKLNKRSKDVLVQCVRFSAPAPLIEPSIELIPLTMSSKWYPIAMNGPRNMFTPTKSEGCEGCGVRRGMRKTQICNYCAFCINIQIYSM